MSEVNKENTFCPEGPIGPIGLKGAKGDVEPYKQRMYFEHLELKRKLEKLHKLIIKYEANTLDFVPSCPIELLKRQEKAMFEYLNILEVRGQIEKVELETNFFMVE